MLLSSVSSIATGAHALGSLLCGGLAVEVCAGIRCPDGAG